MKDPNKIVSVDKNTGRVRVYTKNTEPSLTQQQFKDECDINNIMKKYQSTGQFTHLTSRKGVYADFSQITDYQSMLHQVQYAQEAFSSLPAELRQRFRNDPGQLLAFLQDKRNYDEAIQLGLLEPKSLDKIELNKNNDDLNDDKNVAHKTSDDKKAKVPDAKKGSTNS